MSVIDVLNNKDVSDFVDGLMPSSDGTMRGQCPIHDGTNPTSFTVFVDNSWVCWSCGASGHGVIDYLQQRDDMDYDTAVQTLCEYYNLPLDDEYKKEVSMVEKLERQCRSYEMNLDKVVDYLHKRGFNDDMIKLYRFGYNPNSHCLMIPLFNQFSRIVGFTARHLDETLPKYQHSKTFKKSEFWFNLNNARKLIHHQHKLFLVEGHLDAASIQQMGLPAIAYLGIRPSKEQILMLKRYFEHDESLEIIIIPDADGKAMTHIPQVRTMFVRWFPSANVRVLRIDEVGNDVKDSNDLLKAGMTVDTLTDEGLDMYTMKFMVSTCNNVEQEYLTAQKFSRQISNDMVKADIAVWLSSRWSKSIEDVKAYLNVPVDTKDEMLKYHADIFSCMEDWNELCDSTSSGLGWAGLDDTLDGVRRKEVILLAAYTNGGKSWLSLKIVAHRIIREGDNVLFFSLEMSRGQVIEFLLQEIIGVNAYELKEWRNDSEKNLQMYNKLIEMIGQHLIVIDRGIKTMDDVVKHTKLANEFDFDKPASFVVLDHFHLLDGVDDVATASTQANMMLDYAKEFNLTMLTLCQFNESSQRYGNGKWHEPTMTDIKGSNALKAIAHVIILVWRMYYRYDLSDMERDQYKRVTMVKAAKSRRGLKKGMYFALEYDAKTTHMIECPLPKLSD